MEKTSCKENQIQEFIEDFFASRPVEFCSKCIKELSDNWQQLIGNTGGYMEFNTM